MILYHELCPGLGGRERERGGKKLRPPSSGIPTSPSSCSLKSLDVIKKKGCLRTNRPRGPEAMQLVNGKRSRGNMKFMATSNSYI